MNSKSLSGLVRLNRQGPPSVLQYTKDSIADPQGNEVLIKQEAIALNFVDVLFRNGSFPLSNLPTIIGVEAAGTVEAVGASVTAFKPGDRVGYFFSLGAYAERRLINEQELIAIPDDISFDQAASLMAKGMTARMLIKEAYPVQKNDVILVHAAAGGVGSLISRWAKVLGATVIGTVGSSSKKEYALAHGIDHVITLDSEDLEQSVLSFTQGKGIKAVFDGVGQATFNQSLALLENGGTALLFGSSSGTPIIDRSLITSKNIKLIQPNLGSYLPDQESVKRSAEDVFDAFRSGILGEINPTIYSLSDAAKAHQDLESGQTKGSILFHINL